MEHGRCRDLVFLRAGVVMEFHRQCIYRLFFVVILGKSQGVKNASSSFTKLVREITALAFFCLNSGAHSGSPFTKVGHDAQPHTLGSSYLLHLLTG